jgi:hypothetical protein
MKTCYNEPLGPLFLPSALNGGEWSASRPLRFITLVKSSLYSSDRRFDGLQCRYGRCWEQKDLSLQEIKPEPECILRYDVYNRLDSSSLPLLTASLQQQQCAHLANWLATINHWLLSCKGVKNFFYVYGMLVFTFCSFQSWKFHRGLLEEKRISDETPRKLETSCNMRI